MREGSLFKVSRNKDILYTFILFSDMLCYGSSSQSARRALLWSAWLRAALRRCRAELHCVR
jgi:hypothetical protein